MNMRTLGFIVGATTVVAGIAAAAFLLLRDDDSAGADQAADVELRENGDTLGYFPAEEAFDRAGELLGFEILPPSDSLDPALQLVLVQAHRFTNPATGKVSPLDAFLEYEVSVQDSDEVARISIVQYTTDAQALQTGPEWQWETTIIGSTTVTVQTRESRGATLVVVPRFTASGFHFHVMAPLDFKDQALELTRAFIEAYEASR